ncbi:hypothetical protein KSP39_PZI017657 [Platanthera zijinensis]|uniref:Uncharacterized protein n=1 Tax=Platanthera zijinensis TaxID=2320716 RepID=A0AAP0FZT9_9ASPA
MSPLLDLSQILSQGNSGGLTICLTSVGEPARKPASGKLPEDFGYCFLLKSIDIGENLLSGNLPSSLPRLTGVLL